MGSFAVQMIQIPDLTTDSLGGLRIEKWTPAAVRCENLLM
jgi:hypothetical protein